MFEIEKMEQQFDYSLLDSDTADFLRSCEYEINGIAEDARVKFGKVLVKAREKLANHHGGVFQKWYESGGLDRNNVYYYMDLYESSRNLENSKRENFLKAPKTVQKKVMQKNTPDEVKEAVYSGEVQTNKELKELERQLEQQKQQNATLQQQLEQAENKEPKTVVKEVVPAHIRAQLSDKENELIENRRRTALLEKELNDMKIQSERKTDKSQEKLSYDDEIGSRRFKAESSVLDLRDEINEFLKRNSINAFREGAIATSSQRTKDSLLEGIEELELFCKTMRSSLDSRLIIN